MPRSEQSTSELDSLVRRGRTGDAEARRRLLGQCRTYLRVVADRQLDSWARRRVDASDLVQQAMLDAHRAFDQFRGEGGREWLGWLRRILRNNYLDLARRRQRQGPEVSLPPGDRAGCERSGRHVPPEPADGEPSPSVQVQRADDELRLVAALAQLPGDYQQVIRWRVFEDLPFAEVAQRMDRSRPAVQMLFARAVKRLQESLAESAAPAPDP